MQGSGRGHLLRLSGGPRATAAHTGSSGQRAAQGWTSHDPCLLAITQKQATGATPHGDPPEAPRKACALPQDREVIATHF